MIPRRLKGAMVGAERLWFKLTGRDTLDTSTASETTDGRFGNTLDVVTEDFAVAFGTAFAETFSTFSTCERRES